MLVPQKERRTAVGAVESRIFAPMAQSTREPADSRCEREAVDSARPVTGRPPSPVLGSGVGSVARHFESVSTERLVQEMRVLWDQVDDDGRGRREFGGSAFGGRAVLANLYV